MDKAVQPIPSLECRCMEKVKADYPGFSFSEAIVTEVHETHATANVVGSATAGFQDSAISQVHKIHWHRWIIVFVANESSLRRHG